MEICKELKDFSLKKILPLIIQRQISGSGTWITCHFELWCLAQSGQLAMSLSFYESAGDFRFFLQAGAAAAVLGELQLSRCFAQSGQQGLSHHFYAIGPWLWVLLQAGAATAIWKLHLSRCLTDSQALAQDKLM